MEPLENTKFTGTGRAVGICVAMVVVGVIASVLGFTGDAPRAWGSYLISAFFFTMLGLFGVFFMAISYASKASWPVVLRRIGEAMASYLPVAAVSMLILAFAGMDLYEWFVHAAHGGAETASHAAEAVAGQGAEAAGHLASGAAKYDIHGALLDEKSPFLNRSFFIIRIFAYFAIWMFFAWKLTSNSQRQDADGNVDRFHRNVRYSYGFLVAFGITVSFASFDWIMSLEPSWFSTMFGVYQFAGLFLSGITAMLILLFVLRRMGYLRRYVNENHIHNLGLWMFAMAAFWGYIWFSQYMLIWYSNIPEETQYFIRRGSALHTLDHPWGMLSLVVVPLLNFVIPFFLLLPRPVKRNEHKLLLVALIIMVGRWLDMWVCVMPSQDFMTVSAWPHLSDIGIFIGFAGLFGLVFFAALKRAALVPLKDPYLEESIHHHI